MIISHKHKFIFIKTKKTAGTSLEVFLSQHCGATDIVTPIMPPVAPHHPQNYTGTWNPGAEIMYNKGRGIKRTLKGLHEEKKFYSHISAGIVRSRISKEKWNTYYKFCVERNPWDKTLSHYHMRNNGKEGPLTFDEYLDNGQFAINYNHYTDRKGNVLVDTIVKYESLIDGLGEIFHRLGIPFEGTLGVRAKSHSRKDRRPYQEVYTNDQNEIIEKAFDKEIKLHRYSF